MNNLSLVEDLYLAPENLSPPWLAVHKDLLAKGFSVAAFHMAYLVRAMRPSEYWARNK
jgi:hypothetical protein